MKLAQNGTIPNYKLARQLHSHALNPSSESSQLVKLLYRLRQGEMEQRAKSHRLWVSRMHHEANALTELENLRNEVQNAHHESSSIVLEKNAKLDRLETEMKDLQLQLDKRLMSYQLKSSQFDALKMASSAIMSNSEDISTALQAVVDATSQKFGFATVSIHLLDEATNEQVIRAASGFKTDIVGKRMAANEGVSGLVFQGGKPNIVPDVSKEPAYVSAEGSGTVPEAERTKSEIAVPIRQAGKVIGVLNAESREPDAFDGDELDVLSALADLASIAISKAQKTEELRFLAHHDELTGLYNRRYFFADFQKRVEGARERNVPVGMLVIDMDYFGEVNDAWGHKKGDEVLQLLAHIFTEAAKKFDPAPTIARVGGDEFAIMITLKNWDNERKRWTDARDLRQEIRSVVKKLVEENKDALQNLEPKHAGVTKKVKLGISVGIHDFGSEGNDGLHYTNLKTKVVVTDPEAFLTEQYTKPDGDARHIKDKNRAEARKQ